MTIADVVGIVGAAVLFVGLHSAWPPLAYVALGAGMIYEAVRLERRHSSGRDGEDHGPTRMP